jgi:uncharacterized protein YsxB (DUF464 family)
MIRAEVLDRDGEWQLTISGHSRDVACAAVTAMEQTVAIWLEQLAELNPTDIQFTYRQEATP